MADGQDLGSRIQDLGGRRELSKNPHPEHLRKQAKQLLSSYRKGEAEAAQRVEAALKPQPTKGLRQFTLTNAQTVIAREYGFPSWVKLIRHVEEARAKHGITEDVVDDFVETATSEDPAEIKRFLDLYPGLPRYNKLTALVCGELDIVQTINDVHEKLGPKKYEPLVYVCFSKVHQVEPDRYELLEACARHLLERGANPNTGNIPEKDRTKADPYPALYGAVAESKHDGIVKLLLEHGADPNDGESVYHGAQHNRREALQMMLDHGANISVPHEFFGNTPLYFIARWRWSKAINELAVLGCQWLLEHGADPNVLCMPEQETALHCACRTGHLALTKLLLAHSADPSIARKDGKTAYELAIIAGEAEIAKVLKEYGANAAITPETSLFGHLASGDLASARAMLEAGPSLQERAKEHPDAGWVYTKLAQNGQIEGIRAMLGFGFDLGLIGESGGTALHFASFFGWPEIVDLLLAHSAPLEIRDTDYGATPLGWALEALIWNKERQREAYIRIVKALLIAGASDENLQLRLQSDDAETEAMKELMTSLNS